MFGNKKATATKRRIYSARSLELLVSLAAHELPEIATHHTRRQLRQSI